MKDGRWDVQQTRMEARARRMAADATQLQRWLAQQALRLMERTATTRVFGPDAATAAEPPGCTIIWLHGVGQCYELECIGGDGCAPMNGLARVLTAGGGSAVMTVAGCEWWRRQHLVGS